MLRPLVLTITLLLALGSTPPGIRRAPDRGRGSTSTGKARPAIQRGSHPSVVKRRPTRSSRGEPGLRRTATACS
jgi:hypothetical protein